MWNDTDSIGGYPDIDGLFLAKAARIELVNVPEPGGADGLLAAVTGGKIDMVFLNARTSRRGSRRGRSGPSRWLVPPGWPGSRTCRR